ncbi:diacylglycerol O-acyltransferase 2A [Pleomassaria siparia CBS 279.74]|uniref:diacylglycerol O-acyltransferase n=1 Tax=Pleomassaria siparia CBS 279.74 TaxID=1314801 RepID=A0A6G1JRL6_9PLEO|nr:diacylglycerol O-acyltransferase 2A [Pleomassaria siparia CBS 279.74]
MSQLEDALLPVEPSLPEERAAQDLAPKSYAEAAEEALQIESHDSAIDETKDPKPKNMKSLQLNRKIKIPSGEDKEQNKPEDADQDNNSPKSPTARGQRRKGSSVKSNGSIGRKHGEHITNGTKKSLTSFDLNLEPEEDAVTPRKNGSPKKKRRDSELKSGRQAGAGWQRSKIRWAPLNVPLQRRLQTLAVLMHTLSIAGTVAIFFFLCSIPLLWPVLFPYVIYILFSNAGTSGELSFRSDRIRRLPVWSLFASYFPARLYRSQELEPTRKYIFGYHPHGIISHGAFAAFATEALGFSQLFPGITNTLLTLDANFRLPLYREYALRMGLASVSRESCINLLSKGGPNGEGMGRAITIVVGGARESLDAQPGTLRLVLHCRKGFIKMAIRTGADLVPVLAFGENDIYEQLDAQSNSYIHDLQLLVKKYLGFTVPLFHARGIFNYDVGLMPYRRPLNIVVGRPIRTLQSQDPTKEYVDEVHDNYVKELIRLWDDHKDTFAREREGELEIVE